MQRSLVELYSLDSTITYQHGFVFLRQLAVHLRTAIQNKKPVSIEFLFWIEFMGKVLCLGKYSKCLQLAIYSCNKFMDKCDWSII
jgi:hypothetical protein